MWTYFALIQLGQRHHQSARYRGYHSKKLRDQQDGRMKKHLRSFMISQFKRTFRTIYLDEICPFWYVYVYDDDDDDELFLCYGWPTKGFSLISGRDHCQRSSPSWIPNTPWAGFEPAQNLSSGLVEWSCVVVITTTPRRHK